MKTTSKPIVLTLCCFLIALAFQSDAWAQRQRGRKGHKSISGHKSAKKMQSRGTFGMAGGSNQFRATRSNRKAHQSIPGRQATKSVTADDFLVWQTQLELRSRSQIKKPGHNSNSGHPAKSTSHRGVRKASGLSRTNRNRGTSPGRATNSAAVVEYQDGDRVYPPQDNVRQNSPVETRHPGRRGKRIGPTASPMNASGSSNRLDPNGFWTGIFGFCFGDGSVRHTKTGNGFPSYNPEFAGGVRQAAHRDLAGPGGSSTTPGKRVTSDWLGGDDLSPLDMLGFSRPADTVQQIIKILIGE